VLGGPIPSVHGALMVALAGALALGVFEPKSQRNILHKQNNLREYKFMQSFWVIGGLGLLLINEWARRRFDIENWVWFFGLVRIEMMIAMIAVFAPAYALFLYSKRSTSSN